MWKQCWFCWFLHVGSASMVLRILARMPTLICKGRKSGSGVADCWLMFISLRSWIQMASRVGSDMGGWESDGSLFLWRPGYRTFSQQCWWCSNLFTWWLEPLHIAMDSIDSSIHYYSLMVEIPYHIDHFYLCCFKLVPSQFEVFIKLHLCLSQQNTKHASCSCWVLICLVLELSLHNVLDNAMFSRPDLVLRYSVLRSFPQHLDMWLMGDIQRLCQDSGYIEMPQ